MFTPHDLPTSLTRKVDTVDVPVTLGLYAWQWRAALLAIPDVGLTYKIHDW